MSPGEPGNCDKIVIIKNIGWRIIHPPACVFNTQKAVLLSVRPDFAEAFAAVNRASFTRLKRYLGVFTAFGANRWEHLACPKTAGTIPLGLPCLPATRTALGLIGIAFRLEEFLLRSAEGKRRTAIGTLECLVLETQRMTSFLKLVG